MVDAGGGRIVGMAGRPRQPGRLVPPR